MCRTHGERGEKRGRETQARNRDGKREKERETGRQEGGRGQREGARGGGGRTNFLGLRARGNQGGRRQVARGRQWRGGVRNLGLNLALPLQGAGPPVHLDAKERRNEYAARAVIGPPRPPPPPPPHYNFPNRILQSGPYSLAHKQFCFSALELVNHTEREHLGRRRGAPRARARTRSHAPSSAAKWLCAGGPWVLGWRGTRHQAGAPPWQLESGRWGETRFEGPLPRVRILPLTAPGSVPGQCPSVRRSLHLPCRTRGGIG